MTTARRPVRFDPARVMRPARPQLADALGAVTDTDAAFWRRWLEGRVVGLRPVDDPTLSCPEVLTVYTWNDDPASIFAPVKQSVDARVTVESPEEAWEVFAARDLIPPAWLEPGRRVFQRYEPCPVCGRTPLPDQTGEPAADCMRCLSARTVATYSHLPTRLQEAVLLAADPRGVETVEAYDREISGFAAVEHLPPVWCARDDIHGGVLPPGRGLLTRKNAREAYNAMGHLADRLVRAQASYDYQLASSFRKRASDQIDGLYQAVVAIWQSGYGIDLFWASAIARESEDLHPTVLITPTG